MPAVANMIQMKTHIYANSHLINIIKGIRRFNTPFPKQSNLMVHALKG